MTDIVFHFNAPDRLIYVCRLLRKAVASNARVVVVGSKGLLRELDSVLWTFSSADFLPHCDHDADSSMVNKSPVVLAASLGSQPMGDTLVNLCESVPDGFDQFSRVIEVVTLDEIDRKQARERWKYYSSVGLSLVRHDVQHISI